MAVTAPSSPTFAACCPRKPWSWWMGNASRPAQAETLGGVDINLIPFPMIDRIEILKDGASAIYGADAIAGVFNIILIHKFRGLEIGGTWEHQHGSFQ